MSAFTRQDAKPFLPTAEEVALSKRRSVRFGFGNKYRAIKTKVDGVIFDSRKEARRYGELKLMQSVGAISGLEVHPRFPLLVNGQKVGVYEADFAYVEHNMRVYEDVKSKATMTPLAKLKIAIFEIVYRAKVRIV